MTITVIVVLALIAIGGAVLFFVAGRNQNTALRKPPYTELPEVLPWPDLPGGDGMSFTIVSRTGRGVGPTPPAPKGTPWSPPPTAASGGTPNFKITAQMANPKAICNLTGMEVRTCSCEKHRK